LRDAAISTSTSSALVGRGPENLEIEVDLVERERDVLVRLGLDRQLELLLFLARRDDNAFGDDHRRRKSEGDVAVSAAEALPSAPQPFRNLFHVGDVSVSDDVLGQRLDRVAFEPEPALPTSDSSTSLTDVDEMSIPTSDGVWF
jgi:hypothetical protein